MEIKKIILTVLAGLLFSPLCINAQEVDKNTSAKLETLMKEADSMQIFSGIVAVSKNGSEIYYKQSGYADWQPKRSFTKKTLFNIASITKQFTEEIIHQLVKEGKLKYEDKLSIYLDIFPNEIGDKITIQYLLDMKAGLGDYMRNPNWRKIANSDFKLMEVINLIKNDTLLYEPGQSQRYSNSGYAVLGAIIEKITGKSYEENLKERIVEPLGLKNVYYTQSEKIAQKDRAHGTAIDFEGKKISMDECTNSTPDGGIYSNLEDLMKFAEAKRNSTLPSGKKYGAGSFSGGTPVWNSNITFDEKTGYSFVILSNFGKIADEFTPRINSILKDKPYPPLQLPFEMILYKTLKEKGESYVKDNIEKLAQLAQLPYDDRFLNFFGYQLLNGNKVNLAIQLFRINTELFPNLPNGFDSLGEAFAISGDKENALKNYQKVLELQPDNERVKKIILDLKEKK